MDTLVSCEWMVDSPAGSGCASIQCIDLGDRGGLVAYDCHDFDVLEPIALIRPSDSDELHSALAYEAVAGTLSCGIIMTMPFPTFLDAAMSDEMLKNACHDWLNAVDPEGRGEWMQLRLDLVSAIDPGGVPTRYAERRRLEAKEEPVTEADRRLINHFALFR